MATALARSKRHLPDPNRAADATRLFYENEAERYAQVTLPMSMAPQLGEFLALCPPGPIVDLGCGAGRDLRDMTATGRTVFGLDLSRRLAAMAHQVSGAPVLVADLRQTAIASGVLAGIWASASLLHLPRDQVPAALREAARTLKSGGVMFSSVKAGRGERRSPDGRHFVLHENGAWGRMLEAAGFRLLSLDLSHGALTSGPDADLWINSFAARR